LPPTIQRIAGSWQAFCVVHVLVSGEATENGLTQHSNESMPAILAGARVSEHLARYRAEAERIVAFAVGQQSSIGCNDRASKLERQSTVEIEPENALSRSTRRLRHDSHIRANIRCNLRR
jgi:hypothetical protein